MSTPDTATVAPAPAPVALLCDVEQLVQMACDLDWLQAQGSFAPGARERLVQAVHLMHLAAQETCDDNGWTPLYGEIQCDDLVPPDWDRNDYPPL
jgi:hypothetical protein